MARPTTITRDQILEAARAVFLDRGISGTTAQVARRAGVAEGSIFKRFKTKEELFFQAMRPAAESPEWVVSLRARRGQGDVEQHLRELAEQAIEFYRTLMPLMMMAWSHAGSCRELSPALTGPNPAPLRAVQALAAYFEGEMRSKRLRRHDPQILARAFIGSVQHFVFLELLSSKHALPLRTKTFVRGLVSLIWTGIAPVPAGRVRRSSAPKRHP